MKQQKKLESPLLFGETTEYYTCRKGEVLPASKSTHLTTTEGVAHDVDLFEMRLRSWHTCFFGS